MPRRVFVEKQPGFDAKASQLRERLRADLGLALLEDVRIVKRYDVEGIDEADFERCVQGVFSEPQSDVAHEELAPLADDEHVVAMEYLPGQFDQRADSCAECIQLVCGGTRPTVRTATLYLLKGALSDADVAKVQRYLVNPVEARPAAMELPETLAEEHARPADVEVLDGFTCMDDAALAAFVEERGLAMSCDDLACVRAHFAENGREPTITELRVIDTYWSDHCRHTTFNTELSDVSFDDARPRAAFARYLDLREKLGRSERPVTLMDMGTIAARWLKASGRLDDLDESDEVNACTVKVAVDVDGHDEDWLLFFKNETHNHPTEIEPFGGAATCIGGCIRDPLSGRAWVYQAMRVSGAADPRTPFSETLEGKLPQRKICVEAAQGYSSYGNQIGIATGQVSEVYHPGYAAKRMEVGAVVGAAPAANVVREAPAPGDAVVLVGGRTGRDGIGGATGSSKAHDARSVATLGAEVQKGNAPAERKICRLFRRAEATRLVKRCNDFGAGGVAVAVGELADGLDIDLDAVPRKYEGLDGTELAISESQERMAVVLAARDVDEFIAYAHGENLEANVIARVIAKPRLRMSWRGTQVVNIDRAFLDTNGARRVQAAHVGRPQGAGEGEGAGAEAGACAAGGAKAGAGVGAGSACDAGAGAGADATRDAGAGPVEAGMRALLSDPNAACAKGLVERFDASIGAGSVLAPLGGVRQLTPAQAMVAKLPVAGGKTHTASAMAWGFDARMMENDPYLGAYLSVLESVAKLVASGFSRTRAHLSFQEYFEKLRDDPARWGKPVAALLGALDAQLDLGVAAIGGKDSMSGSFEDLDVPPTLVSFAVAAGDARHVVSPELKGAGHALFLVAPAREADGVKPAAEGMLGALDAVEALAGAKEVLACAACGFGGVAESLFKMCVGNRIGVRLEADALRGGENSGAAGSAGNAGTAGATDGTGGANAADGADASAFFSPAYGAFIVEVADGARILPQAEASADVEIRCLGETTHEYRLVAGGEDIDLAALEETWTGVLEEVYPWRGAGEGVEALSFTEKLPLTCPSGFAKPHVVIPVFPGTNCEFDSAEAFEAAGATTQTFIVNNLSPAAVEESSRALAQAIERSQIVMLPGGFSGGDEPDGAAKLIASFFRNPDMTEAVRRLLFDRDGLMLGICNGFQALVKLGLVPFGDIVAPEAGAPTLASNTIGRHASRLVHTRVASTLSPWLSRCEPGEVHTMPVSHGEGRFTASDGMLSRLVENGQVATQYCDADGRPGMDLSVNPNGSVLAIEGITSPDGRVFGKMGHTERSREGLYLNIGGQRRQPLFEGGVDYFA